MVNAFGDNVARGPGNLHMAKKVVVIKGKFKDYVDEIRKSYELGSTPYRLHTNSDGTFVTPILFIVGGYIHWPMLLQWRLVVARLRRIQ